MLNETGSDLIRCIYNPGAEKRIRLSSGCHSSLPTGVANNVEKGYFKSSDISPYGLSYDPAPNGDDPRYGSYWTIAQGQAMPVPAITAGGSVIARHRLNAILYCRTLEHGSQKCIDNPLRSATRTAKIFIDGVQVSALEFGLMFVAFNVNQVASASHVDNTSKIDPVCYLKANLRCSSVSPKTMCHPHFLNRIAYPHTASYLYVFLL